MERRLSMHVEYNFLRRTSVMTDLPPEPPRTKYEIQTRSESRVAIVAILAIALVLLACIAACAVATTAFLMNPPW
ncbi:MAG TPA: hypothetical protein VI776_08995 [Anaerolineales bacterium]|nr:hypothetical protein [Anaerolineales bacterium]